MTLPLSPSHIREGGHMVDFHGYILPVRFSTILEESRFVREQSGIFDISHMGHFVIRGRDALGSVDRLVTSNLEKVPSGKALYGHLLTESGGVIDDVMAYHFGRERVDLVVNASNRGVDGQWIREHLPSDASFVDLSPVHVGIALQGPGASGVLARILPEVLEMKRRETRLLNLGGSGEFLVARTGYTGEDGWEFFGPSGPGVPFYEELLASGKKTGNLLPCGLGARDLLRLEMGYPLYGQELTTDLSPFDAGLDFVVSRSKGDFVGKSAVLGKDGLPVIHDAHPALGGFILKEKGIPRTGCLIENASGIPVGHVTSGGYSPRVGGGFGLAYMERSFLEGFRRGEPGFVRIHGNAIPVLCRKTPFVSTALSDGAS